jgi:hypothetical protein
VARSRPRQRTTRAGEKKEEDAKPAAAAAKEEKTPEQALADKLELDRFVERLRRKFH